MKPWHGIIIGITITLITNAIGVYGTPRGESFAFFIPGIIFWSIISALGIRVFNKRG